MPANLHLGVGLVLQDYLLDNTKTGCLWLIRLLLKDKRTKSSLQPHDNHCKQQDIAGLQG